MTRVAPADGYVSRRRFSHWAGREGDLSKVILLLPARAAVDDGQVDNEQGQGWPTLGKMRAKI